MMRDLNTDTDKKRICVQFLHVRVLVFKFCILHMPPNNGITALVIITSHRACF